MTQQTEREKFESWYKKRFGEKRHDNPTWENALKCDAYEIWQAALESKAQDVQMPEPAGYLRKWAHEGEKEYKVLNPKTGRMWLDRKFIYHAITRTPCRDDDVKLYTEQQVRALLSASNSPEFDGVKASERVPLTDARILEIKGAYVGEPNERYPLEAGDWIEFARAIERAHGIYKP